ncbi:hypothetical protein FRC08_006997 [Ceratobasidium sp. 394]|nr:hypothetical protein FRC08_006997 [Ceratobasidium sp. 394]
MRQTPDRPKEFPSFEEKEINPLWDIMLKTWAYNPSDRPTPYTVKNKLKEIRPYAKLHALIIGINKYRSNAHSNLDVCVSDATSVYTYFRNTLRVPRNQLLCLFDERATRRRIVNGFLNHLILNENLRPSDPIVIYFSGHGKQHATPGASVERILPHDAGSSDNRDNPDNFDSDRAIGGLVHRLSEAKGDNITMVFDFDHSGSAVGEYDPETHVLLAAC